MKNFRSATKYQVQSSQINLWKKKLIEGSSSLFTRKQDPELVELKDEQDKLYKRIGQQTMDIDFLKKKCTELNLL